MCGGTNVWTGVSGHRVSRETRNTRGMLLKELSKVLPLHNNVIRHGTQCANRLWVINRDSRSEQA